MPTMNSPETAGIGIRPERTQKNEGTKCPRRGLEMFRARSSQAFAEQSHSGESESCIPGLFLFSGIRLASISSP